MRPAPRTTAVTAPAARRERARRSRCRVLLGRVVGLAFGVGAALLGAPSAAHAATAHGLAVIPASGTLDDALSVSTSGPCAGGTFFHVLIKGAGLEPGGSVITGATEIAGLPRTSDRSLYAPLSFTLRDFFADQHVNAPRGRFTVILRCRAKLDLTSLDDFAGIVTIDSRGRYRAVGDAARVVPAPDGGGVLGPDGSAMPPDAQPTGIQPVAAATSAHRPSYTWQLFAALVVVIGGLVAVRRRSSRPGTRPDVSTNLRKVGQ
ncbi:MAG: hypothetical protein QOF57_122 [Frankiaceae bacterium]|nr:hypothetical protein [Frankiaceae bacterium]